jgi:hypothetical protein
MLTTEYNARMELARAKFAEKSYADGVKHIFTMENCGCGNLQLLWMLALESYDPTPGATNILTEAQLQCLFCRMGADGAIELPATPVTPAPAITFEAQWAWMPSDPYAALLIADGITYQGSGTFTDGAPINADFRPAPSNQYMVVRYPTSQTLKTEWEHDIFNYGTLPDSNWRTAFTAYGYNYMVSYVALTLTPDHLTKFF